MPTWRAAGRTKPRQREDKTDRKLTSKRLMTVKNFNELRTETAKAVGYGCMRQDARVYLHVGRIRPGSVPGLL